LLVLPTGTGKTIVFASVAETFARQGRRTLILAHREELLQQAADKIKQLTGLGCSVEKAENDCLDGDNQWFMVTVGSVQTLMRDNRREKFDATHYDAIIVDEAHHTLAQSYLKVLGHFPEAKILGVTATPDRGDLRNLGEVYESIAFEYRLPQAIRDGFLVPIRAQTIPLEINLSSVRQQAGDFHAADLGCALDPYLDQIANEIAEKCADRKTVVFLPLIATSKRFCEILQSKGIDAREVNGESQDRAHTLKWFTNAGKGAVLSNAMLLTEGWDEPSADCIVCLRPTKIRSLYAQIIGRGTRLFPEKENLLLLDFLWMTSRHQLCRPSSLICDNAEIAEEVTKILAEEAGGMDLEEAVEKAESDSLQKREEALAKKLSEMRHRKRALVDPLQFEYSIEAKDLTHYEPAMPWEMGPPSDAQKAALEKSGIFPDEIKSAGEAAMILDRIIKRRGDGLTTPKQIRFLEKVGFRHVGMWQFDTAKKLIDRIAANRWQVPHGINPSTFEPGGNAA
jgi:superfamily II DNA or RNA helicase